MLHFFHNFSLLPFFVFPWLLPLRVWKRPSLLPPLLFVPLGIVVMFQAHLLTSSILVFLVVPVLKLVGYVYWWKCVRELSQSTLISWRR